MALRNKVIFSDENNNVGIGEAATSGYRLLVKDTATNSVPLRLIGTNNYTYDFSSLSNGVTDGTRLDICVGSGAGEFSFTNSGGELLRIKGDGKVGIGTNDPDYMLDVNQATGGTANYLQVRSASHGQALLGVDGSGARFQQAGLVGGCMYFQMINGTAMVIDCTMNVGIGEPSPDTKLHISGSGNVTGKIVSTNASAVFQADSISTEASLLYFTTAGAQAWKFQKAATTGNLEIRNSTDATKFTMLDSGNVGIGESTPAATLHVEYQTETPLAIFDEMLLTSTNTSQGAFGSERWGWYGAAWSRNASSYAVGWGSGFTGGTGGGAGDFGVHTVDNTCAQNTDMNSTNLRFVVKNDGKVGIGTSSPDSALHLSLGGTTDQGDIAFTIGNDSVTARQGRILKNTSVPYDMYYTASMNNAAGSCILFENKVGSTTVAIDRAGAVAITPDCMCDANPLGTLCLDITGSTNPQNGGLVMNSTSQTHIRFLSGGNLCFQWRHWNPTTEDKFSVYSWKRECEMFSIQGSNAYFGSYGHITSCAPMYIANENSGPYFQNLSGNCCINFYYFSWPGPCSCFGQTHLMARFDHNLTNVCNVRPTATLYNANTTEGTSSTLAFAGRETGGGNSVGLAYISGRKEDSTTSAWGKGSLNFLVNCAGQQCWTMCMTMCGGVCVIKCLVSPSIQLTNNSDILCLSGNGTVGAYLQGSADCTASYWGIDGSWKAQVNSTGGFCAANCVVAPYVQGTCVCGTSCVHSACGCFADITAADGVVPCSTRMHRYDNRCVCASGFTTGHLYFGFGSYDNDGVANYADWLLLSSYGDSTGGNINFLTINRNGFGMRLYQRGWANSSTPSSTAFGTDNYVEMIHSGNISSYVTGTTINNNADNRVITGSGTADTLNGEASLTFDGTTLIVGAGGSGNVDVNGTMKAELVVAPADSLYDIGTTTTRWANAYIDDITITNGITGLIASDTNNYLTTATGNGTLQAESGITFDGSTLNVTGAITATGDITSTSDCRVKSDINSIECAIFIVNGLCGRRYTKDNKTAVGVIAQEVEKVLPEVVHGGETEGDMKSVSYGNITAVLIEAIKEQQKEIELLKRIIFKNGNSR